MGISKVFRRSAAAMFAVMGLAQGVWADVPIIGPASLPNGIIGVHYSTWIYTTEDDSRDVTYSIVGSLPRGLDRSYWRSRDGIEIYGIPTQIGTSTFTVKAENESGSDTKEFTIVIETPPPPPPPPVITTTSLPDGEVGEYYFASISVNSGVVRSIGVPPGLYALFGTIYGYPTKAGTYTITVEAENVSGIDTKSFTITIIERQPPVITTNTLPNSSTDISYITYVSNSFFDPSMWGETWSIVSGSLPPGLQLMRQQGSNPSALYGYSYTVVISGIPTKVGTYTFTVRAENNAGYDTKEFTIVIGPPPPPPPPPPPVVITTATTLPNGNIGAHYIASISADGSNIAWSVVGSLPSGLQLDKLITSVCEGPPCGGIDIAGIPAETGTYTFTIIAENENGTDRKDFTIVIEPRPSPVITTTSLPNGEVGVYYYGVSIHANGSNITWSVVGSLPPGLQLESDYGDSYTYISGTPTKAGTYTFTVKAENENGSGTKGFTIVIRELQPPVISATELQSGEADVYYNASIHANGSNITWSVVGSLPPGLDHSSNPGYFYINGYPTQAGAYTFTVKAENAVGSSTAEFTIMIDPPPVITTTELQSGEADAYYSASIHANGSNIRWSVDGSLPPGLDVDIWSNSGQKYSYFYINGTPAEAGTYNFAVIAENGTGADRKDFTIVIRKPRILQPPVISTANLPSGETDVFYNELIYANVYYDDGSEARDYIYLSFTGNLPAGFNFNPYSSNGSFYVLIYGYPAEAGIYAFTVSAENSAGVTTKDFTIGILGSHVPVIVTQPASGAVAVGTAYTLTVAASVTGGGTLSYQWYSNTTASNTGGTAIANATSAAYTVPASAAGTYYYYVVVTGNIEQKTANVTSDAVTVTVNKATPSVTAWPTSTAITYGAALSTSALTGGTASVTGSFAWTTGTTVPTVTNSGYEVRFTPTNAANYNTVSQKVSITVNKAAPSYTLPTSLTATYGAALSSVTLPTGGWSWESAGTTLVGNAGTQTHKAKFTPPDAANYNVVAGVDITITVNKATPSYTVPTTLTATYGDALSSVTLPSGWSWESAGATLVGNAGTQTHTAKFTPTDAANYTVATGISVDVTVAKASPTVTWPTGFSTSVGKTLSEIVITGGTGAGTFSWTTPDVSAGEIGERRHSMTFTPTDGKNYNVLTENITVTVGPTDAVLLPNSRIPSTPTEEATVIAPITVLSGEFTAGPNPVVKSSGSVNFYRQGRRVAACELYIYDATGNIINKVKIKDNAIGSQSRRVVGSWDLADRKGRLVSEGTYLVKGVIKTSDGKSEKVSLIIGVR